MKNTIRAEKKKKKQTEQRQRGEWEKPCELC